MSDQSLTVEPNNLHLFDGSKVTPINVKSMSSRDILRHIAKTSGELQVLARKKNLQMISYLLAMVFLEVIDTLEGNSDV